jgi:nucleoside phosphorylase
VCATAIDKVKKEESSMTKELSYAEGVRLHYDPERPEERFLDALPAKAQASANERLPQNVPWPPASQPTAKPLSPVPDPSDDLSESAYDAIVVTYTSAEAAALAALFTPKYPVSAWYEYRCDVGSYITLVTGENAPFNSMDPRDARYRHSLGLYFPCMIGKARVLLFKSGLHLDYDLESFDPKAPPASVPIYKMLSHVLDRVKPKLFITTGTGGGIGGDVKLGDVVIAGQTLFDCNHLFTGATWAHEAYKTTLPARALSLMTTDLLEVNAAKIAAATPISGRALPKIWSGDTATIVTTDVFAFDTTSNKPYELHGLGQACDMGDAMAGQVISQNGFGKVPWYAIRNASDPQIPDPAGVTYAEADKEAGDIYRDYGPFTTAASVIASWAIIDATFN